HHVAGERPWRADADEEILAELAHEVADHHQQCADGDRHHELHRDVMAGAREQSIVPTTSRNASVASTMTPYVRANGAISNLRGEIAGSTASIRASPSIISGQMAAAQNRDVQPFTLPCASQWVGACAGRCGYIHTAMPSIATTKSPETIHVPVCFICPLHARVSREQGPAPAASGLPSPRC